MKLGMALPQYGSGLDAVTDLTRFVSEIEQLGYDSLWAADGMLTPLSVVTPHPTDEDGACESDRLATQSAFADPFLVVAVATSVTNKVRLNFTTLGVPPHEPIHLACTLTTLDVLSGGRLDVGFGLQWRGDEYDATKLASSSRGQRLDDIMAFLRTWWTTKPAQYESDLISFPPSQMGLRPVQSGGPPIYLGGASPGALERVGRSAAGWLSFDGLPDELAASLWSTARREAETVGRDPDDLRMVVRVNGEHRETVERIADRLARAGERGADEAIVDFTFTFPTVDERIDAAEQLRNLIAL